MSYDGTRQILMQTKTSFWQTIPRKSVAIFLLGVFLIFTIMGFANDIMALGSQSIPLLAMSVVMTGLFAISYAVAGFVLRAKMWRVAVPLFLLEMVILNWLGTIYPKLPIPTQMASGEIAHLQSRLALDGLASVAAMMLGYFCFVYVSIAESRRYSRVHSEMALAAEIHRTLVPTIATRIGEFEFYGRSLPSGEVGGDLVDLVENSRGWMAYLADVSGHGVAPGVLMAMVKSAARMQLSSRAESGNFLERMNAVLYPIKKPEMFATFAYLAWNGARMEYSLAGHPAILHYRAASREVAEVSCANLPVGMFAPQEFVSGTVECAPGDLFVLLTDGVLEVENAAGEEFGASGVNRVLKARAQEPLDAVFQGIVDAAKKYGRAVDDQSMLMVRRTG